MSPESYLTLFVLGSLGALAAIVVPIFTPVATTDDWAYARSAQILLAERRLVVFPVVAATAVFQIVWGAIFGLFFGPTFGAFRLSTVVITALGGVALYDLCCHLGVSRGRGALGVATLLFNPLVFVLAFTFMTDAHFMALLTIAAALFVRAIAAERIDGRLLVAGSAATALALLTRQQGVLIVPAVLLFLLVTRRLRFDWATARLVAQVVALPLLTALGYALWLRYGNDVPHVQQSFFREVLDEGWRGTWWLLRRLTVIELMYLGFFTLPLIVAMIPATCEIIRQIPPRGWLLVAVWQAILLIGVTALWVGGARMPYIGQFFGSGGLGPPDIQGSRPILLGADSRAVLTAVCLVASLGLALVAGRGLGAPPALTRSRAGLVLSLLLWQVIGVLPPSYHYIGWSAGSLDRYLLPLIPLTIALALWGLRGTRIVPPLGWIVVAALALFAVAGTRDYLVFMRAVWAMGSEATVAGVPLDRLDAGSGWDGYYLYEYGLANHVRSRTPKGGPWWVYFYAPATDSAYVVAGKPLAQHTLVQRQEYSSWLQRQPVYLYLLRRWGNPWPPGGLPRWNVPGLKTGGQPTEPSAFPLPEPTIVPFAPATKHPAAIWPPRLAGD